MQELTVRQRECLDALIELTRRLGYPPTVREICEYMGLSSTCTVHRFLKQLENKGYIERPAKWMKRGLRVKRYGSGLVANRQSVDVPILGSIAAGPGVFAEENFEDIVSMPAEMLPEGDTFMLRVRGDSMTGDGIYDGDLVVVVRCEDAADGDLVAAVVGEEATVKRIYRENSHIRLEASNPDYEPILASEVTIVGRVVMSIRKFE